MRSKGKQRKSNPVYQILIVMTPDRLIAVEVAATTDEYEAISCDGNREMTYETSDDLCRFNRYIMDHYNVSAYDDSFSIMLINCGANADDRNALVAMLSEAPDYSVIDARYVLPMIVAANGWLYKKKRVVVSLLGQTYTVERQSNDQLVCAPASPKTKGAVRGLDLGELHILYRIDASLRLEDKVSTLQTRLNELESEVKAAREREKARQERISKQRVPVFANGCTRSGRSMRVGREYRLDRVVTTDSLVPSGKVIARARPRTRETAYDIMAPIEGRVVWLNDRDTCEGGEAIAVIDGVTDAPKDVIVWYQNLQGSSDHHTLDTLATER